MHDSVVTCWQRSRAVRDARFDFHGESSHRTCRLSHLSGGASQPDNGTFGVTYTGKPRSNNSCGLLAACCCSTISRKRLSDPAAQHSEGGGAVNLGRSTGARRALKSRASARFFA